MCVCVCVCVKVRLMMDAELVLGLFVFYDMFPCPFPRLTTELRSCAYYSQHLSDLAVLPVRTFFSRLGIRGLSMYPYLF